jgi:hypothetical protein
MSYQDDPNLNRDIDRRMDRDLDRRMDGDGTSYTGWIVGGVLALAIIVGIFALSGRTDTTNTAANTDRGTATAPANTTRPAPATTGSAVQPNNPAGNIPTAPTPPAPAPR